MIHRRSRRMCMRQRWPIIVVLMVILLTGCATVREIVDTFQPELELKDVRLTSLSFQAAELALDVGVKNSNPFPIDLSGFDYDLKINEISFLKGQQEKYLKIAALGDSTIQIPVTLNYQNLYDTFESLREQDMSGYHIDCGLSFELPGLGITRIPLSAEGEFPAIKLPDIKVDGIQVKKLSMSGADIDLNVRMQNPNAFVFLIERIDYDLTIEGKSWMKGFDTTNTKVTPKGEALLRIPMSLDFEQIGLTVYQVLSGKRDVNYRFQGKLGLGTSLPLLKQATLPFQRSGTLNILR